ncbi:ATP-binding protein [candidate division KSB1 bacterium]|nr:ATP-binding protein [candidate division KSB1 bacterium]
MKRLVFETLRRWKESPQRKPILLRGARQVGKTFLVREVGKLFPDFVEINFELRPDAGKIFDQNLLPDRIIRDLSLFIGKKITPGNTLLFFDEIQAAPKAIQSLRYFYEMRPELHLISAGSLIDFELEKIGMPVGRVTSIYMYPLSFLEFMMAKNESLLIGTILAQDIRTKLAEAVHDKLLHLLGEYFAIGGMPEAVQCWVDTDDLNQCGAIHRTIVDSFRQDFNKYATRFQIKYVELLFNSLPALLGQKFKYSKIPGEYRKRELMPSFDLLVKAGVAHKIVHSSGTGIPLGATADDEKFKTLFLDLALAQTILGVDTTSWLLDPELNLINQGPLTEAFVGQELLAYSPFDVKAQLYYWHREAKASNAEVDYLIQKQNQLIPIEVKSGASGKLKSLKIFLDDHQPLEYGIRFSSLNYEIANRIRNIPLYAVAKIMDSPRDHVPSLINYTR